MGRTWHISLLFVFLWSSAYIAIDYCSAYVEPLTFVVVRAAITATILGLIILVARIEWPKRSVDILNSIVVGILIHGVYAGGLFASIYHGVDLVLCALILSLQPLLTVLFSSVFLAENLSRKKLFGILVGFLGVTLVVLEGNAGASQHVEHFGSRPNFISSGILPISLCFLALLGISSATIVQKKYCSDTNPIAGTCIQYTAAGLVLLPIAILTESMQIDWNLSFVLGLSWLVVFVSIGAMTLLMFLIKHGEAGSVASLLYLVTPFVSIEAWILFGDEVSATAVVGMALCMVGVVVVNYFSTVSPKVMINKPIVNANRSESQRIMNCGTCGNCGGRVSTPKVWYGLNPPTPQCESCGAEPKNAHGPVLEMKPQSIAEEFKSPALKRSIYLR